VAKHTTRIPSLLNNKTHAGFEDDMASRHNFHTISSLSDLSLIQLDDQDIDQRDTLPPSIEVMWVHQTLAVHRALQVTVTDKDVL
jgi:hypothetical protein